MPDTLVIREIPDGPDWPRAFALVRRCTGIDHEPGRRFHERGGGDRARAVADEKGFV